MSERNLLDALIDAERNGAPQPTQEQARAGWSRLQRSLPSAVVLPQIDVPPASVETAAIGKLGGLGKIWLVGKGGWLGKTIVGAVVATTVGTVGVIATRDGDTRRDPPAAVRAPVVAAAAHEETQPLPPATLPATPPVATQVVATPPVIATAPVEVIATPPSEAAPSKARTSRPAAPASEQPRSATPPKAMRPSLDSERALIDAINLALGRNDAAEALAQVREHASRFPKGTFAEDREALRVVALCRLGRAAEAERARKSFLSRWPSSMHTARVRAACSDDSGAK